MLMRLVHVLDRHFGRRRRLLLAYLLFLWLLYSPMLHPNQYSWPIPTYQYLIAAQALSVDQKTSTSIWIPAHLCLWQCIIWWLLDIPEQSFLSWSLSYSKSNFDFHLTLSRYPAPVTGYPRNHRREIEARIHPFLALLQRVWGNGIGSICRMLRYF